MTLDCHKNVGNMVVIPIVRCYFATCITRNVNPKILILKMKLNEDSFDLVVMILIIWYNHYFWLQLYSDTEILKFVIKSKIFNISTS